MNEFYKSEKPSLGELELKLIERLKARQGGIIMIVITVPFIVLSHHYGLTWLYWFFSICLLIWSIKTFSLQIEIMDLRDDIKEELGINE